MQVEDIEIHSGAVDFPFQPIRRIEAACEAASAFSSAPSISEVNARMKALAAKLGANAVVEVEYKSGVSFTSWRSLKGTGLAVLRLSDEMHCPVCAETIKRAAVKCRFCGAETGGNETKGLPNPTPPESGHGTQLPTGQLTSLPAEHEPLRSSDAMPMWVWLLIGAIVIFGTIVAVAPR